MAILSNYIDSEVPIWWGNTKKLIIVHILDASSRDREMILERIKGVNYKEALELDPETGLKKGVYPETDFESVSLMEVVK